VITGLRVQRGSLARPVSNPEPIRLRYNSLMQIVMGAFIVLAGVAVQLRPHRPSNMGGDVLLDAFLGCLELGGLLFAYGAFWTRTLSIDADGRRVALIRGYPPFFERRQVFPLDEVLGARVVSRRGESRNSPASHFACLVLRDGTTISLGRGRRREGLRQRLGGLYRDALTDVTEIVDDINTDLSALGVDTKRAEPPPEPADADADA